MRKLMIVAAAVAVLTTGCMSRAERNSTANRHLVAQGYRDIQLTGSRWTGCAESDNYAEGFEATTTAGVRVSGVVCWGYYKGSTIRVD